MCVRVSEGAGEANIVIFPFCNSLTSYELSFFGISNFGFDFALFSFFLGGSVGFLISRWRCSSEFPAELSSSVGEMCDVHGKEAKRMKNSLSEVERLCRQVIILHRADYFLFPSLPF